MNIRKLTCLILGLSGCTLTLSSEPPDQGYAEYEESRPASSGTYRERARPVAGSAAGAASEPTFLPPDPEPVLQSEPDGLRDLTLHMSGMAEEIDRFMKVRVASRDGRYVAVGILHQGIPSADYSFTLPRALREGIAYTVSFFADTDENGGYSPPPADHAWSLSVPAGYDDVVLEFEHDDRYVDIERDAPRAAESLVVSFRDMQEYYKHPLDVRVIERETGRLVGRQLREVPGDRFDLTIGGVIEKGVSYQVDVAVDIDEDGHYDRIIDDSWRIVGTADSHGLAMTFVPNGPYVDVGF